MRLFLFVAALLFVTVSGAKAQDQATVVSTCGAAHLTAGTQAFRQVDTNGVTCSAGGGTAVVSSVWSASDAAANGMTLSNGGLTVTGGGTTWVTTRITTSKTTGKAYIEFHADGGTLTNLYQMLGLASSGFAPTSYLGSSAYSGGIQLGGSVPVVSAGFTMNYFGVPVAAVNDVWALAVDFTAGSIWIAKNNVWVNSSNPATGSLPIMSFVPATVGPLFAGISLTEVSSWTLKSTAASQTYTPPTGFTAWDSGGATGCSQATAYLARATGETAHAADLTTLICGLVSDGVWAKLDALYVLAQQTQADARLNLVSASYPLTGTATFTAYQGFSAFPTGGLNTGFNPASAPSPNFTQNSASIGFWPYAVLASNSGADFGDASGLNNILMAASYSSGNFVPRLNDNAGPTIANPGNKGLFVADRASSSQVVPYWNGGSLGAVSSTSSAVEGSVLTVGYSGIFLSTLNTISEAHIGASLGSAGNLALYTRLRAYLTSVGVP